MKFPECLIDHIGREYPRKNQWIQEMIDLRKANKNKEARQVYRQKSQHPYQVELANFKKAEEQYLEERTVLLSSYQTQGSTNNSYLQNLKAQLQKARFDLSFYEPYVSLTYEAELAYREAESMLEYLPGMIDAYQEDQKKLSEYQQLDISNSDLEGFEQTFGQTKQALKADKKVNDQNAREKFKEGVISKTAYKNTLKKNQLKYKNDLQAAQATSPQLAKQDAIRFYTHKLKMDEQANRKLIQEQIADVRRATPTEVERNRPWLAYLTALFPGLGQLMHKQYFKAGLFLIGSLFIYLVAVPYMLGFGNYQGDGIAGLITLAEGGIRLDRSIIFMIEGIIALILGVFAVGVIIANFLDVRKVEKQLSLGIRPSNDFEVRNSISRDGFPFLANFPAVILIAFIVLVPIITTILLSFTNMDPQHQAKFNWIGLDNYMLIAQGQGLAGKLFWKILAWTVIWTLSATSLQIFIGMALALILNNSRIKGKSIFRTIYILPWAIPAFITILFFSIMVAPNGYLTEIISGFMGQQTVIKNSTLLSRTFLILLQGWLGSSYIFLLTSGVLQSIPADLYEAADIDGATNLMKLRRITIPLILFQVSPLLISQYTFNFNNYSIIALFNDGGPFNPSEYGNLAGSTDILVSYIFKLVTQNQYQAVGAAITVIISLALMLVTFIGFNRSEAFKEG